MVYAALVKFKEKKRKKKWQHLVKFRHRVNVVKVNTGEVLTLYLVQIRKSFAMLGFKQDANSKLHPSWLH